jgi:putative sugar O-methyltransferase
MYLVSHKKHAKEEPMKFIKKRLLKMKKEALYRRNIKMLRFPTLMRPLFDTPLLRKEFLKKDIPFEDTDLDRICAAFNKAETCQSKEDIWTELTESNSHFIQCLRKKDFEALRRIFSNLFHGPLLTGMGHTDVFMSKKCPHDRNFLSIRIRDTVLSLAEALSVKSVASAHQTPLSEYIKSTNDDLEIYIDKIESALGHSVSAPDVGKPPVAIIGKHIVSPDSIRHAYIMHRVKQLGFNEHSSLLEIGGGFGNVARYACLRGFRNYTIIDLPHVAAIQAAFLFATVGPDKVSLFGEEKDAPVKIIPADQKNSLSANYDLVINMDSLPEINLDEAIAYLKMTCSQATYFLSINQEAQKKHRGRIPQHRVPEIIQGIGGFKLLHRNIYWMEQGYIEELYQTKTNHQA